MFRIRIDGKNISSGCQTGEGMCKFMTGAVNVRNPGNVQVFADAVTDGTIMKTGPDIMLTADLVPQLPLAPVGGFVTFDVTVATAARTEGTLSAGTAVVAAVPEPGTLGLLGTGVIGLAGMVRRRLKLGR